MANSGYIEKAKAGASKAILDAMPRILRESAAIGKNKYKYIKPDGEELPIEIDDTDAKSLAYAATKMAERLIELSNKAGLCPNAECVFCPLAEEGFCHSV